MGSAISAIRAAKRGHPPSKIFGQPLSQVQDQWVRFRTLCADFWIDYEQFHKIFKEENKIFGLWDFQKNELINALEVFGFTVLKAAAPAEPKARLLFDMFDFNDLNSLSLIDVEHMLETCLCAALRGYGLRPDGLLEQEKTVAIVEGSFVAGERILVSDFVRFFQEDRLVGEFLAAIGVELPKASPQTPTQRLLRAEAVDRFVPEFLRDKKTAQRVGAMARPSKNDAEKAAQAMKGNLFFQKKRFIEDFIEKIHKFSVAPIPARHSLRLEWVYGFRFREVVQSLIYQADRGTLPGHKEDNQRLIYSLGHLVVVFCLQVRKMFVYNEHTAPVTAFTLSEGKSLVASAEAGPGPSIRLWELSTGATQAVLHARGTSDIYLLKFFASDSRLVAAMKRFSQPVAIFDVLTGCVLQAFLLQDFLFNWVPTLNLICSQDAPKAVAESHDLAASFFAFSRHRVYAFAFDGTDSDYHLYEVTSNLPKDEPDYEIVDCFGVYSCRKDPLFGEFSDLTPPAAYFFLALKGGRVMSVSLDLHTGDTQTAEVRSFGVVLTHMTLLNYRRACVVTSTGVFHLLNVWNKTVTFSVSLTELSIKLDSYDLKDVVFGGKKAVFFVTRRGEIVKLRLKKVAKIEENLVKTEVLFESVPEIFVLDGPLSAVCHLEVRPEEQYQFIVDADDVVHTIATPQHKLVSRWLGPKRTTSVDATYNQALGIVNVLGSAEGQLVVRVGLAKILETYDCKAGVVCVRFSPTGRVLIASTKTSQVFVFTRKNGLYFKQREHIFRISGEVVVSVCFTDDLSTQETGMIILGTNLKNHYVVDLHLKDHYQPLLASSHVSSVLFKLRYPIDGSEDSLPVLALTHPFFVVAAESYGGLTAYDSLEDIKEKITGVWMGHSSQVSEIIVDRSLTQLTTLAGKTGEVFEWKLQVFAQEGDATKNRTTPFLYHAQNTILNQINAVKKMASIRSHSGVHDRLGSEEDADTEREQKVTRDLLSPTQLSPGGSQDKQHLLIIPESDEEVGPAEDSEPPDRQLHLISRAKPRHGTDMDSIAYFRSFVNTDMRRLYRERATLQPGDRDLPKKMFPEYSLKLKYVYGMSTYEFKNVCWYVHMPSNLSNALFEDLSQVGNPKHGHLSRPYEPRSVEAQPLLGADSKGFNRRKIFDNSIMDHSMGKELGGFGGEGKSEEELRSSNRSPLKRVFGPKESEGATPRQPKRLPKAINDGFVMLDELQESLDLLNSNQIGPHLAEHLEYRRMHAHWGRCGTEAGECSREIVYIASRLIVITNPLRIQNQRYYEGHKSQVSALTLHSVLKLAASGEVAFHPKVHVWTTTLCFPVAQIDTYHEKGIFLLEFLPLDGLVVSVSVEPGHSVQVSDWKKAEVVAFRNTGLDHILSLKAHPLHSRVFLAGSNGQIGVWRVRSQNIVLERSIVISQNVFNGFVNTINFLVYPLGRTWRVDIIATSSHGQTVLCSETSFTTSLAMAESSIVSVVRVVQFDGLVFFFVGFEDGHVRGFSLSFQKVFEWRETERMPNPKVKTRGVQSLDVYFCTKEVGYLLVMSRDGKLFELELVYQRIGSHKGRFLFKQQAQSPEEMSAFVGEKLLIQAHASQLYEAQEDKKLACRETKKVFVAINKERDIMATIGDDEYLFVWDFKTKAPLKVLPLQVHPSAIKFTHNNRLLVGFLNGKVKIFDLEIMQSFDLGNSFTVVVKEHPFVISDPEITTPVLNLEFSDKGERLAVTYDISRVEHEVENRKKEYGGFIVSVFQLKSKSVGIAATDDETPFRPFDEMRPSILNQFEMSKILCQNMAIHFMQFSEDFVHLVVYLQKTVESQIRNNNDQDGQYIIRNVTTQQIKNSLDDDHTITLKNVVFPSHVYGVRLLADFKSAMAHRAKTLDFRELEELANNKIILSAICDCDRISVMGSTKGELFLARSSMFSVGTGQSPIEFSLSEMVQAKSYPAHVSFVNQIELDHSQKFVFTTGISDECVLQWELENAEELPDPKTVLDVMDHPAFCPDIPSREGFSDLVRLVHPTRNLITKVLTNKDVTVPPLANLEIFRLLGRRALSQRNNIVVSATRQLVYTAGTSLVVVWPEDTAEEGPRRSAPVAIDQENDTEFLHTGEVDFIESCFPVMKRQTTTFSKNDSKGAILSSFRLKGSTKAIRLVPAKTASSGDMHRPQGSRGFDYRTPPPTAKPSYDLRTQQPVYPAGSQLLTAPGDISCIELSPNKQLICVGISDSVASLQLYDITSLTPLRVLFLESCRYPVFVRFSLDSKYLFCCGLESNYSLTVYFVDLASASLLAVLNCFYSPAAIFKDGHFLPTRNDQFVLVGPSIATLWKYSANLLSFQQLTIRPIFNSVEERRPGTEARDTKFDTVLLCMRFVYPTVFVAGTFSGHLCLWKNEVCQIKVKCYKRRPVTTILPSPLGHGEFLTGGFACNLKYFKVVAKNDAVMRIECITEISLEGTSRADGFNLPSFQVQSLLWTDRDELVIGYRDGSIDLSVVDSKSLRAATERALLELEAGQEESFSEPEPTSFVSTYRLANFFDDCQLLAADFSFNSRLLYCLLNGGVVSVYSILSLQLLQSFEVSPKTVDILCLELFIVFQLERGLVVFDAATHQLLAKFSLHFAETVSMVRPDPKQKFIAVAFKKDAEKGDLVRVFRISLDGFSLLFESELQLNRVKLLDFSVDSETFVFVDSANAKHVYQVCGGRFEAMGSDFEYHTEWSTDGLKVSKALVGVHKSYAPEDPLVDIVRLTQKSVVAISELGTVA